MSSRRSCGRSGQPARRGHCPGDGGLGFPAGRSRPPAGGVEPWKRRPTGHPAATLSLFFATRGTEGLGAAFNLAATGCYVVVTLLFFGLFKPVDRTLSLIAACFSLVGCTIAVLGVFQLAPAGISPLVFFGAYCLLIGVLILRSTFLPRFLGWLMIFGGLGWLTFLSPTLAGHLKPFNFIPGILGELVLTVWLLVKGVDVERWRAQASAQRG